MLEDWLRNEMVFLCISSCSTVECLPLAFPWFKRWIWPVNISASLNRWRSLLSFWIGHDSDRTINSIVQYCSKLFNTVQSKLSWTGMDVPDPASPLIQTSITAYRSPHGIRVFERAAWSISCKFTFWLEIVCDKLWTSEYGASHQGFSCGVTSTRWVSALYTLPLWPVCIAWLR